MLAEAFERSEAEAKPCCSLLFFLGLSVQDPRILNNARGGGGRGGRSWGPLLETWFASACSAVEDLGMAEAEPCSQELCGLSEVHVLAARRFLTQAGSWNNSYKAIGALPFCSCRTSMASANRQLIGKRPRHLPPEGWMLSTGLRIYPRISWSTPRSVSDNPTEALAKCSLLVACSKDGQNSAMFYCRWLGEFISAPTS